MTALPSPGQGRDTWGVTLNAYLKEQSARVSDATAATSNVANTVQALTEQMTAVPPLPLATLPHPFVIGHRGGADMAPENTAESYAMADAAGVDIIEGDCQPMADGTLVCMHDATVDRTTNGTGNVSDYTWATIRGLNAAAKLSWWPGTATPILWRQVLEQYATRRAILFEAKDHDMLGRMLDDADAFGAKGTFMVEAPAVDMVQSATDRGYKSAYIMFVHPDLSTTTAALEAGATYLRVDASMDPTLMGTIFNMGPTYVGGDVRRSTRDRVVAVGAVGVSTDDPVYVKSAGPLMTRDSWRNGYRGHGLFSSLGSAPVISSGALVLSGAAERMLVGEVGPVASAFTLTVSANWKTAPDGTTMSHAAIDFCLPDDANYDMDTTDPSSTWPTGYRCQIAESGAMAIWRWDNAAGVNLVADTASSAMVTGTAVPLKVTVTATQITFARTDTGTSISTNDTAYRYPGYVSLDKNTPTGSLAWSQLQIS